ncbi:DUF2920 family protein [Paenibacillus segetis]|uniref:DUF2920 family protein n=1 Tax=Paenibacillus segetis TaxID=1325360 RepID=A0ABQ1YPL9_9BACL|nr:DUF2920 family protein [Paenibacillus segetis]GGH33120.1 hypothetical protein GCM10008013_37970 [Paenibacillus segetis]
MSRDYDFTMAGHPNIYTGEHRDLKVYFSEPDAGVNEDTGVLLFIAGYGGHAGSNVYVKMRKQFADLYNLVCIQCDYFGYEFMQAEVKHESIDNFNDMSIMQSLDNITSVLAVISMLKENNLVFNEKKIICYGQSHGGYLALQCNRFVPDLFSLIIDNSAYIYPVYLKATRCLPSLNLNFNYFVKRIEMDDSLLYLPYLYTDFCNTANIVCFHGINDNMIHHSDKERFCNDIKNCTIYLIKDPTASGGIFSSTEHGLGADFLRLFDWVINNCVVEKDKKYELSRTEFSTKKCGYRFDFSSGLIALEYIL